MTGPQLAIACILRAHEGNDLAVRAMLRTGDATVSGAAAWMASMLADQWERDARDMGMTLEDWALHLLDKAEEIAART